MRIMFGALVAIMLAGCASGPPRDDISWRILRDHQRPHVQCVWGDCRDRHR